MTAPSVRERPEVDSATEAIIDVAGLVKRYGSLTAVDGIDLCVQRGEIFGILGPNGAGKTTTLEMIEGLRKPDAGSITVARIDAVRRPTEVKRVIGVQLQSTALFDYLTVRELIGLFADLYGADSSSARLNRIIETVALGEKTQNYVNQLSGGQQQRLSIALALVNDPRIVFLDEPTTGLDPQARRNLWEVVESIRANGKTIVLTTHYMEEAEVLCDRVAVMDHGNIIACDTPQQLIDGLDLASTLLVHLEPTDVPVSALRTLPGVAGVERRDEQLALQTRDVPATVAALLAAAGEAGWRIDDLTMTKATLEDVFLQLTGRSLRE